MSSWRKVQKALAKGSTSIIVIITIVVIVAVIALIVHRSFQNKKFQEIQRSYSACYMNLSLIEKALMEYRGDHRGKYPKTLKELTPRYIREIPACPQAGKATYSYMMIDDPPLYFLYCQGQNHQGPPDTPQIVSDLGFFPEKCDNPMTVVFENGQMKTLMAMLEESNQLIEKKKYDDAIEILKKMLKIQKTRREGLYYKMAHVYFKEQQDARALEALDSAIEITFDLGECLAMESSLFKEANRPEVLKILKKHYGKKPDDVSCVILYTKVLDDLGEQDEARKVYDKALQSGAAAEMSTVCALYCEGQVLRLEGKDEEALDALMSIRDVQTRNLHAENYICTLSEEYIKALKERAEKK